MVKNALIFTVRFGTLFPKKGKWAYHFEIPRKRKWDYKFETGENIIYFILREKCKFESFRAGAIPNEILDRHKLIKKENF